MIDAYLNTAGTTLRPCKILRDMQDGTMRIMRSGYDKPEEVSAQYVYYPDSPGVIIKTRRGIKRAKLSVEEPTNEKE